MTTFNLPQIRYVTQKNAVGENVLFSFTRRKNSLKANINKNTLIRESDYLFIIMMMQAFVCMMQRDWPQVHRVMCINKSLPLYTTPLVLRCKVDSRKVEKPHPYILYTKVHT